MALIKEYFELTKSYQDEYGENTILLMQVGSFFEVYAKNNKKTNTISGSKINDFSQICELNVVEKNVCVGSEDVLMAGFKDIQIQYIKNSYRIIYWLSLLPVPKFFKSLLINFLINLGLSNIRLNINVGNILVVAYK